MTTSTELVSHPAKLQGPEETVGRGRWGGRMKATLLLLTVIASAVFGLGSAGTAAAAADRYPRAVGTVIAFQQPTWRPPIVAGYWNGTPLEMQCWTDNIGERWFLVRGLGFNPQSGRVFWYTGFVQASRVSPQRVVGHC